MGEQPFIKFYPSDFLAGTSGLSPAERGVYITLLCLIYEHDGPIQRDDARLARRCGSPKAAFVRTLDGLIAEGKITQDEGMLSNRRAEKALMDRTNRTQNSTHAANQRWGAQGQKMQQKQRAVDAGAMPSQCVGDASQKPEPDVEAKASTSRARKRASRLPADWVLPSDWGLWALDQGFDEGIIRREADKFKDYWIAASGQKATKLDWFATWRNWLRNVPKQEKNHGKRNSDGSAAAMAQRIGERWASRGMDSRQDTDAPVSLFSARRADGGAGGGSW